MQIQKKARMSLAVLVLAAGLAACERSTGQKVEDTAEDAAHEVKQGAERVGEKAEDAVR